MENSVWLVELKAFDETKRGVKGLVNDGISTVPTIFIHPLSPSFSSLLPPKPNISFSILVVKLNGIEEGSNMRKDVIKWIQDVLEKWGFFPGGKS